MSLVTSEGDTLFIATALMEGWREGWCHWFKIKCQKKKKKLQQIPLCSGGHKAICLDFNYEGLWERGTLGSTMNHCHSASLLLDKNAACAGRLSSCYKETQEVLLSFPCRCRTNLSNRGMFIVVDFDPSRTFGMGTSEAWVQAPRETCY